MFTINQEKKLTDKVLEFLVKNKAEHPLNPKVELMQMKAEIVMDEQQTEMDSIKNSISSTTDDLTKKTLQTRLEKLNKNLEDSQKVTSSDIGIYFNRYMYLKATQTIIQNNLLERQNIALNITPNDDAVKEGWQIIKNCYRLTDDDFKVFIRFLIQIKQRLYANSLDISGVGGYESNYKSRMDIMPCFWGPQGTGKTEFGMLLSKEINGTTQCRCIDNIIGQYGLLDVFSQSMIQLDEFGKQNKSNLDLLKSYINGETVQVNRKYEEPIIGRCFSSFIMTTNSDPRKLYGTEQCSRRIHVIEFNSTPTDTLENIAQAIHKIWMNLDYKDDTFFRLTKTLESDLSIDKVSKDIDSSFCDWYDSLDDDGKLWMTDNKYFTVTGFFKKFQAQGIFSKDQARNYLSISEYFTCYKTNKNEKYHFKAYDKLMQEELLDRAAMDKLEDEANND